MDVSSISSTLKSLLDRRNGLKQGNNDEATLFTRFKPLWASRRNVLMFLLLPLSFLTIYALTPTPASRALKIEESNRPANFHLLIPASKPNANLCKTLLSAAILGYESPVIINWNETHQPSNVAEGGFHLARVSGIRDYVNSLDETHDEDLVLVADGKGVWFQLRPQILIDRYFDINRRAHKKLRSRLGAAADKHHIQQEIVFGSQKDVSDQRSQVTKYRQRSLSPGVILGTVRAVRKLFDHAVVQMESESTQEYVEHIFSQVYEDQELWRELARRESVSLPQRLKASLGADQRFDKQRLKHIKKKATKQVDKTLEFGIGVDSRDEISLSTAFAKDDTQWLTFGDENQLRNAYQNRGKEQSELATDIDNSLPPFWTFSTESLPRWTSWHNVSLFTNIWTHTSPAVIYHGARGDDAKSGREADWPRMWFQRYARILLDAHIYAPVIPIAASGYDEQSVREYWPYEIWKGGARNGLAELGWSAHENDWLRYDDLCRDFHEELFRDGQGPWELPENH